MNRIRTLNALTLMALCTLLTLASCSRDEVDEVRFSVSTEGNVTTVKVDEPICFLFNGHPDYITFYAGDEGNNFAYRNRTTAELSGLQMACTIRQQYNDVNYLDQELIHIYLSTDFTGEYTVEALHQATWIPISGNEYGRLPVPIPTSASAVETSGSTDLSRYIDINKPFYVAVLYQAPGRNEIPASNGGGRYITRPRVDVTNLYLNKTTVDGQSLSVTNASTGWGFRTLIESTATGTNYQLTDNGFLFQPQKATLDASTGREPDEMIWMVSQEVDPCSVEPDRGTPIKSIEGYLGSYSYSYRQAGTYTATFIATNANLWNSEQEMRQLTIQVNNP